VEQEIEINELFFLLKITKSIMVIANFCIEFITVSANFVLNFCYLFKSSKILIRQQ